MLKILAEELKSAKIYQGVIAALLTFVGILIGMGAADMRYNSRLDTHERADGHRVMVERVNHMEDKISDISSELKGINKNLAEINAKLD